LEDSAQRLLERARERLEEARRVRDETVGRYEQRQVSFSALLLADDELERAQGEYDRLLELMTPSSPREQPSPGHRLRREPVSSPSEGRYREPKEPTCSDCSYHDTRLEPLGQFCKYPGQEDRTLKGDSEPCEHFVAVSPCPICGHPIGQKRTRPPKYCSDKCRKLAWWRKNRGKGQWEVVSTVDLRLGAGPI
jgi:hypothetical protein